MYGRSWVEVNLGKIRENALRYKGVLCGGQDIIAVVKANAYGHGALRVARVLYDAGVRNFAVSNLDEAVELRRGGIEGSILILSYTPVELLYEAFKYELMQAVYCEEYARSIFLSGVPIKVQLAIDTGMHRIGFDGENPEVCIKKIKSFASGLRVVGIFTHLASADCEEHAQFTKGQLERFSMIADATRGLGFEFVHSQNSAGGIWHGSNESNFVRVGIMLYGLSPTTERTLPIKLLPAIKWKSKVAMVKTVKPGGFVGYGLEYEAKKATRVATITTGYGDGYSRRLGGVGKVFIGGKSAPVIGRVCMDQLMIDASDFPSLSLGEEVELLNESYTADCMAKDIGTIGYEVVCAIGGRVTRIYTDN